MAISVRPLHDQIVVELIKAHEVEKAGTSALAFDVRLSAGGVALPDSIDNEPSEARVLAIGDEVRETIAVGDRVLITPWSAVSIIGLEGRDYHVISERDVLGKVVECDT